MFKVLIGKRQVDDVIEYQIQDYVIKSGYIKSGSPYILSDEYIRADVKDNPVYKTLQETEFTDVRIGGVGKNRALTTKKNSTDVDNISQLPTF